MESALKYHPNFRVIGFIDKNKLLQGSYISGKKVFSSKDLPRLIDKKRISEILIAIPSLSRRKRFQLLQKLKEYPVIIKSIPSLSDLTDGNVSISDLKKVNIEDLLQREVRKPITDLITKDIHEKVIWLLEQGVQ